MKSPRKYTNKAGLQTWKINGKCHRLNGPAMIYADGTKLWYVDGKLHRLDGPALIYSDGTQAWYLNNDLHRLDGPAYINANNRYQGWYVNGNEITDEYDLSLFDSEEGRMILLIKYFNSI